MRIFLSALALSFSVILVSADEIRLNDGVVIRGKITAETGTTVMMKTSGGTIMVERSTISSLSKSDSIATNSPSKEQPQPSKSTESKLGPEFWPPRVDHKFPELTLYNQHGKIVSLSKIARGRVVLLEPVGMTCQACQAFSGGHQYGPFQGVEPQSNLTSIEESFPQYTQGGSLSNPNIVFVQLILFNMNMDAPTPEEIRDWAKHFKLAHKPNTYVLAGTPDMVRQDSYDMIPGFLLIDKDFVLRADASGPNPKHNLWQEVLPSIPVAMR